MFDERFARQYRYELPSEFPLTSPFSGIVHHLSGPNGYAQTQISRRVEKNHYVISPRTETTHPLHESRTHAMCKPNEYTTVPECTQVGPGTFTSPKTRYHVPNVIPACTLIGRHNCKMHHKLPE